MPQIHFKLHKSDGHTRRISFQELPTWTQLTSKLQTLYGIPIDKIGISYIDNDNDEITANSNEELQDFYQTSLQPGQLIKFSVLDLSVPRDAPISQSSNPSRNTFGQNNFDFPDSDWQPMSAFAVAEFLDGTSRGPHAFVEVINSDSDILIKDIKTGSEDGQSTVHPTISKKGKGKASSIGSASAISVIDEQPTKKFPVHVLNHAVNEPLEPAPTNAHPYIAAQSTPRVEAESLKVDDLTNFECNRVDHPLPPIDALPSNGSTTLSHDFATFLDTLSNVISSHPELSENFRSVVQNAANGTYWQGAGDMGRPSERSEEGAARRVSEALGNFFRSMSLLSSDDRQNHPVEPTTTVHEHSGPRWSPFPFSTRQPRHERFSINGTPMNQHQRSQWQDRSLPFEHPLPSGPPHSSQPHRPSTNPVSLPSSNAPITTPSVSVSYTKPGLLDPLQPVVPLDPPVQESIKIAPLSPSQPDHPYGRHGYRFHNEHPPYLQSHHDRPAQQRQPVVEAANTTFIDRRTPDLANNRNVSDQNRIIKPTARELRSQVEEARRVYKAQKEIYRRARQERMKAKAGGDIDNSVASVPKGPSQIISNAWGSYPQLEIYSAVAPRRHQTHPAHGLSRPGEDRFEGSNARVRSRIAKRLADMGFSEHLHPNLSEKIRDQMTANKLISKEEEDDIVTSLLEQLLAQSAKSPVASGSGSKVKVIPGEWDL